MSAPRAPGVRDLEEAGIPASAEVVYWILREAEGPLTQREIRERTSRPSRTVRHALTHLREAGLVKE